MTAFFTRPDRPDAAMTGSEFRELVNRDPYWHHMAAQFQRAFDLYWEHGTIAHIVATFPGMPASGWGEIEGKVLLPMPVKGDPVELAEKVTADLDFAAGMFARLYGFIPARLMNTPTLTDMLPEDATKQ